MAPKAIKKRARREGELVRPTAIDRHIGTRVRARRQMLGLSQQKLAAGLGVTWQQLQKNEKGTNRIGASRLHQLSGLLDVPIRWFFDEMPDQVSKSVLGRKRIPAASVEGGVGDLSSPETIKLVRAYYKIEDPAIRAQVRSLAKSLAAEDE
jgi:transcriptional regulator with XRE-family HTH domain